MTLNNQNSFNTNLTTFSASGHKPEDSTRAQITTNNNNNNSSNLDRSVIMMSPFDEQEEWAKISEIMESFGSGIARESVFVNDMENEFKHRLSLKNAEAAEKSSALSSPIVEEEISPLKKWLADIKLEHLEEHLLDNGYDNPAYLNGLITNENDLEVCGIPVKDRHRMLTEIIKLPKPPTLIDSNQNNKLNNNQHPVPTVDQWLASIQLEEYIDVFK
jgi:ankyrin repeat and SAM domain-containing protein 1